jgi:hypothetical protein
MTERNEPEYRCGRCNILCDTPITKQIHEKFCEVPYQCEKSFVAMRNST